MSVTTEVILQNKALGFPWETSDPFLFCVYHDDAYPRANTGLGPEASLSGRNLGQDFSYKDGWSMYHGTTVPGFPAHPHRGFETVTIVRKGLVDHSDSLGAAARYGRGDVQWLTAGAGVMHAEMFPLLDQAAPNPLEMFQIWLNLPARNKMVEPHFRMLWAEDVPRLDIADDSGHTEVSCIAGRLPRNATDAILPLAPPPDSWAAQDEADVAIWTIRMSPGARWTLPAALGQDSRRSLYFFKGESARIAGTGILNQTATQLRADVAVEIMNGPETAEFLLLQGRPINEPVVQHGPFVMNTQDEILEAIAAFRRTGFGAWPWPDAMPVHGHDPARFARHPDGTLDYPEIKK